MRSLWRPLDEGRRTTLPIQIVMRWVLVAVALFIVNYEPGTSTTSRVLLNTLVGGGAVLNGLLQWQLRSRVHVITALPVALAVYDVAAITAAVGIVDRFDNGVFVLYYPALLAFTLVFPGRWSLAYTAITIGAYLVVVYPHESFDLGHATDLKQLVARLVSMGTTVLIANLVVGIERARRERAVAIALTASAERQRIANELHDSVAQSVYMLTMNLEANADLVNREVDHPTLQAQMGALVPMARRALLETRSLLFDLEAPLSGDESLSELVRRHVEEFAAVTGVQVEFEPDGAAAWVDPETTVEVYRVVQESLANVYRHAGVDTAQVRLHSGPPLIVEVTDAGAGFDEPRRESARGLASMHERARRIGAQLTVSSTVGRGTTVRLERAGAE